MTQQRQFNNKYRQFNNKYRQFNNREHYNYVHRQFVNAQKKKFALNEFISNCLKDSKKLFELYLKEKSYEHIDRFLQFWNSYKYSKRARFYSANHYQIDFDYYDYEKLYKDMMFVLQNSKQIIRYLHFKEHLNNVEVLHVLLFQRKN